MGEARRVRVAEAGLTVAALAVGLALAEVATRLFLPAPQTVLVSQAPNLEARLSRERREQRAFSLPVHPEQGGLYVETATGRRLRANTAVTILNHSLSKRTVEIVTNSLGFRNPEIGPKRGTRMLFLGDSITFGDYLPEDETFVRQVAALGRAQGRAWETVNAGVGGVSLANELAILLESGLSLEPDVVVLNFYLNDFQESRGVRVSAVPTLLAGSRFLTYLWLARGGLAYHVAWSSGRKKVDELDRLRREFVREHPTGSGDFRTDRGAFNTLVSRNFQDWGGSWNPAAWQGVESLLTRLGDLAVEHGFRLMLVIHPVRWQVETEFLEDYPQQRFGAAARRLNVPCLDLLPALREAWHASQDPLFYDQCHHTPRGSRLVAGLLADFLATAQP